MYVDHLLLIHHKEMTNQGQALNDAISSLLYLSLSLQFFMWNTWLQKEK